MAQASWGHSTYLPLPSICAFLSFPGQQYSRMLFPHLSAMKRNGKLPTSLFASSAQRMNSNWARANLPSTNTIKFAIDVSLLRLEQLQLGIDVILGNKNRGITPRTGTHPIGLHFLHGLPAVIDNERCGAYQLIYHSIYTRWNWRRFNLVKTQCSAEFW